ncbi:uncharacterized protein LOC144426940 [Styela clava]
MVWSLFNNGDKAPEKNNWLNYGRGRAYEAIARSKFCTDSGIDAVECGFFQYGLIGASPDALLPTKTDYILEIKTRAANQDSPLKSLDKSHIIQTQIQKLCTRKKFAVSNPIIQTLIVQITFPYHTWPI